jgi:hypothetical protein
MRDGAAKKDFARGIDPPPLSACSSLPGNATIAYSDL